MIELNVPAFGLRVRSRGDDGPWEVEADNTRLRVNVLEMLAIIESLEPPLGYWPDKGEPVLRQLRDEWLGKPGTITATEPGPMPDGVQ